MELHSLTRIFLTNKTKIRTVRASWVKSSCWCSVTIMTPHRTVTAHGKTEKKTQIFSAHSHSVSYYPAGIAARVSTRQKRYLWSTTKPKLNYRRTGMEESATGSAGWARLLQCGLQRALCYGRRQRMASRDRGVVLWKGSFLVPAFDRSHLPSHPFPDPRASMSKLPCTRIQ